MKDVSPEFLEEFNTSHIIEPSVHLSLRISHNRYANPSVNNYPPKYSIGSDEDLFPLDSITGPTRPLTGLSKARVGLTAIGPDTGASVADIDDRYKYWVSPVKTNSSGFTSNTNLIVQYDRQVVANRIVVGFEITDAKPTRFIVMTESERGTSWEDIGNSFEDGLEVDENGQIVLYYNGEGWTTERNLDHSTILSGVGVIVQNMDKPDSHVSVIEVGAELEKDVTEHIVSVSDTFDAGDTDDVLPVGTASANIAQVTLDNPLIDPEDPWMGFLFDGDNTESIYYGLTESNVEFTCWYEYRMDSGLHSIPQFKMYTNDKWSASTFAQTSIDLTDSAKFLQESLAAPMVMENYRSDKIVERLLNSIGWNRFVISEEFKQYFPMVTYYWTDGTQYVWEALQELSVAHQIAFWFDELGVLHVQPREEIYDHQRVYTPAQVVRAADNEDGLANLLDDSFRSENTHRSNIVNVAYKVTDIESNNYGEYLRTEAWAPEGDVIIGASDLIENFTKGQTDVTIRGTDAETWPFEGFFNVGGEICSYKGKEIKYSTKNADQSFTVHKEWLYSSQEYQTILNKVALANLEHLMYFTGKLGVTERAMYNSTHRDHVVIRPGATLTSFSPSLSITREEVAATLYRISGSPAIPPGAISPFIDIGSNHSYFTEIYWLHQQGITTGFFQANGTKSYQPDIVLYRAELAAFLYRLSGLPTYTAPAVSPFTDLPKTELFYKEVCWMAAQGITTGYDNGNGTKSFRPWQPILREQFAAFMYRYKGSPAYTAPTTSPFVDVSKAHTFYKEINWMAANNYMTFFTGGTGYRMARVLRGSGGPNSPSTVFPMGARPGVVASFGRETSVFSNTPGKFELMVTPDSAGVVGSDIYNITTGDSNDILAARYYGTRIRFPSNSSNLPRGGLHFYGSGAADHGYYVEIRPTKYKADGEKEVRLFTRNSTGHQVFTGGEGIETVVINEDQWYVVDVRVVPDGDSDDVYVLIDGQLVVKVSVTGASRPARGGRFGLFCRNASRVLFDYLYAVSGEELDPNTDTNFFDMYYGGYMTDFVQKEIVGSNTTYTPVRVAPNKGLAAIKKIHFYDEFGPIVHEMMPFDVTFSADTPFISPTMISTNEQGITIVNQELNPFGGKFLVANSGRADEALHGELNDVTHRTTILGYGIRQGEQEIITVRNEPSIRAHGTIEMDVESEWIQSAVDAQRLADWITGHWARAKESCELEAFIPTHLQIGDLVMLDSTLPGVGSVPKYFFVTAVNTDWDNGIKIRLSLREA